MSYLHSKGIVHRDLKTENILLTPDNKIKLVDFGTSRDMLNPDMEGSGIFFWKFNKCWEKIRKTFSESFPNIFYHIFLGTGAKGKKNFKHFVGTPNYMPPECIHNIDSNYKSDIFSLAGTIYQINAGFSQAVGKSEYLIFKQTLEQPLFFAEEIWDESPLLKDLLSKMLVLDMNERISLEDVKKHEYW